MAIPKLVPGFRFSPTGVELIKYFLKRKVLGKKFHNDVIAELDIYKYAPWDLPELSYLQNGDLEWYFFCPIEKKYRSGPRMKRATEIGFWKATGQDRAVQQNNQTVGMIKTLIFHTGKSPRGDRTNWVMHEYRLEDKDLADKRIVQDSYVICKVFQKEGPGPRNGAQYGRPFNEEDWSDDEVGIPFAESAALVPSLPVTSNCSVLNDQNLQTSEYIGSISMPCQSELVPSPDQTNSCQTGLTPSPDPANPCQTGFKPYPDPVNSCQTGGFMPSPNPANSCQTGLTPSPDPSNSCQTGFMPYADSVNSCQTGFMPASDPANSCQTEFMPYPDPVNSCQTGFMPASDPANSCQTEFMPSPDLASSCEIGLMPLPDPANDSYPDNQAVNNDDDDILAMLDIFKDNSVLPAPDPANDSYPDNQAVNNDDDDDDILAMLDIFEENGVLPEENIAEGAVLTDFFDGLEDVDCSAELGSVGQNADFSTYGLASTGNVVGHDDFDFMELIDLDSDTFWQTQPESWSRNK